MLDVLRGQIEVQVPLPLQPAFGLDDENYTTINNDGRDLFGIST
jgi:hypothetical protein